MFHGQFLDFDRSQSIVRPLFFFLFLSGKKRQKKMDKCHIPSIAVKGTREYNGRFHLRLIEFVHKCFAAAETFHNIIFSDI